MNTSSKSKKIIRYLCVVFLFVCYMLLANRIVYSFKSTEMDLHKIDSMDRYQTTAQGYCKIEQSEYKGGEMEKFRVYGWAYAEGNGKNLPTNGKTVDILLTNQKGKTYLANASVTIRPDIFYSETEIGHKPMTGNTGFEAVFSTLLLPNGTYDVQVFVSENEEVTALMETGVKIAKTNSDVHDRSLDWVEPVQNLQNSDQTIFALDHFVLNEQGNLLMKGWGIHSGITYGEVQMFLQITDSQNASVTYQLTPMERDDIQEAFGEQYLNSGFSQVVRLPENLNLGKVRIRFILKNDDVSYLSTQEITADLNS